MGHLKIREHECPECGLKMSTALHVRSHIKTVHKKIKDSICEHCGAGFSSVYNLREHVKVIHLNVREYRCDECGYEMSSRSNLRKHLIMENHTSKLDKIELDENTLALIEKEMNYKRP